MLYLKSIKDFLNAEIGTEKYKGYVVIYLIIGIVLFFKYSTLVNIKYIYIISPFSVSLFILVYLLYCKNAKFHQPYKMIIIFILFGVTCILISFYLSYKRYEACDSIKITKEISRSYIQGTIDEIKETKKHYVFTLKNLVCSKLQKNAIPEKIVLYARKNSIKMYNASTNSNIINTFLLNYKLNCFANIHPLQKGILDNLLDQSFKMHFNLIGGIAFNVSNVHIYQKNGKDVYQNNNNLDDIFLNILKFNDIYSFLLKIKETFFYKLKHIFYITKTIIKNKIIKSIVKDEEQQVAIGMLLGENAYIDKNLYDIFRYAGTSHIIAISGMHIAVIAYFVFICIKFCFSQITFIILFISTRKIAAFISIIITGFYTLMVGAPISAIRAFICSTLFLTGIILDKPQTTTNSLIISQILILIIRPEEIFFPGTQMSFSACIGLIMTLNFMKFISRVYNIEFLKNIQTKENSVKNVVYYLKIIRFYFLQLIFSSIGASLFTIPITLIYFKSFSLYNLASNIICIPLSDFFIMPLGVFGISMIPFGFENLFFTFMQYGIFFLISVSRFFASLPYSYIQIQYIEAGFSLFIFCITSLLIFIHRTKYVFYLFLILNSIGLFFVENKKFPDLVISENAKLFGINEKLIDNKKNNNIIFSNIKGYDYLRFSIDSCLAGKSNKNEDLISYIKNNNYKNQKGANQEVQNTNNITIIYKNRKRIKNGCYKNICVLNVSENDDCQKNFVMIKLINYKGKSIFINTINDNLPKKINKTTTYITLKFLKKNGAYKLFSE